VAVKSRLGRDVRRGIRWGLYFAAAYSLYVVAVVVLRGPSVLARQGVTLIGLVLAYFGGGIIGGAITGALLPIARKPLGAMVVGFFAAVPVCFLMGMLVIPSVEWSTALPVVALGVAALLGPLCALGLWYVRRY
jgi:hypothetical protein